MGTWVRNGELGADTDRQFLTTSNLITTAEEAGGLFSLDTTLPSIICWSCVHSSGF